jgi:uncharacterized membrane-anchored protein YhcB (DUF1043 family)
MIYLVATAGLIAGFVAGLVILRVLLRNRSPEELRNNRSLRWRYGTLCWLIAFAGAYAFVVVYQRYFLG